MAPDGENFRGINAVRILDQEKSFTIDKMIAAGYDTQLAAFEKLVPALINRISRKSHLQRYPFITHLAEPIAF